MTTTAPTTTLTTVAPTTAAPIDDSGDLSVEIVQDNLTIEVE